MAELLFQYKLILPPIIGALIGWLTNFVAIKLLFRPLKPVAVLGFRFQGLIPKRRKEIARSIAGTIEREVISSEDITGLLSGIDWESEVEGMIHDLVERRLGSEKVSSIPVIGLASKEIRRQLKRRLTKDIIRHIDKKKHELAGRFKDGIDIKELMVSRIDNMNFERFEALLTGFISRELKHLEYLGGLMGLLIGLAQSIIFFVLA
ncbi:MAG: DUF445 domain-containing protein [Thermodesulfobacteriota bacterium]